MADTVPAMLEPGEYVIRKDAAEEIGIDNLDMLNNVDRSSQMYMNHGGLVPQLQNGHSAIDDLLAINTLNNQNNVDMTRQTGMFNKGGAVKKHKDNGKAINSKKGYFDRDFPKDSFKDMIKKAVDSGEINTREGLQHILNKQQKDFMESKDDTLNILYKQLQMQGYQNGGQVESPQDPDPLQIDARMRREFSDIGTIGMVDSSASLGQMLDKIQQDNAMRQHLERRYGDKPEALKAHLEVRKDDFMPQEEMMRWLNYAAKQTQPKPDTIKGYQNGGAVTYGGQTVDFPDLQDIYTMAGVKPIGEQAGNFQEYDISREQGALDDYSRGVENLRSQGAGALGQASLRAQNMGGGFAGFGGRQASQDALRRQTGMQYQSGLEQAGQRKFETIRGMREQFIGDTMAQLGQLEGAEGTQTVQQPARVVSQLPTSDEGDVTYNGTRYVFYQGEYITESELDNIREEEQDRSGDEDWYYD